MGSWVGIAIRRRRALLAAALCLCFAACAHAVALAQSSAAAVTGLVRDPSDAVLPAATIQLTSLDTGRTADTTSSADGSFQFLAVPPGRYRLLVSHAGFVSVDRVLELTLDERRDVDVVLPLQGQSQSITVVAPDPPIDVTKTSLGRTITTREIDALPVPSGLVRDFTTLATLAPGIVSDTTGTGIAAAGQTGNNNTFYLDGLNSDSAIAGGATVNLPLGAVREFRAVANHFTVEFGQASGAVVNVITRSGSNTPTGRFEYLRQDAAWNATSPTARLVGSEDPGQRQDIFSGFLGGPIVRNRAFFFGAPEQVVRRVICVNTSPVLAMFRPDDPRAWPMETHSPKAFARGDVSVSSSDVLTVRGSHVWSTGSDTQRESLSVRERGRSLNNRIGIVAVTDTHVLGSSAVNEARVQWAHSRFETSVDGFCPGCAALNYPDIRLGKPANAPQFFLADRVDAADVLTWAAEWGQTRHSVKAGAEIDFARQRGLNPTNTSGTYVFRPGAPPFDPSNALSYPARFTRNVGDARFGVHETIVSVFGQDQWQIRRGVSATVGLRWDHTQWPGLPSRHNDVAPRLGISLDPWGRGVTAMRAAFGRYYDESQLMIARDARTGFVQITIDNPGFQGSASVFDPFGPNPRRNGPAVVRASLNGAAAIETPYTDQASVGVQRQFSRNIGVTVDLVRALGRRLPVAGDLNYPDPITHVRPDPAIGQIIVTETRAHSWHTALEIGLRRRFSNDHAYSVAYTWSTSENDTDGRTAFPQDRTKLLDDRGPAGNDARHRLSASGVLSLPFGCQASAVVTARTAVPYNITTGSDDNQDLVTNDRPAGVGRNSARGSGFFSADVRFSKTIALQRARIEVLVEAFNVTNHANWSDYNGVRTAAAYGRPTSAEPPRQLQVGARLGF